MSSETVISQVANSRRIQYNRDIEQLKRFMQLIICLLCVLLFTAIACWSIATYQLRSQNYQIQQYRSQCFELEKMVTTYLSKES